MWEQQNINSVLVTGATGFIGRHVAKALDDAGCMVTALVRHPGRNARGTALSLPSVRPVLGDLSDLASLERALEDVDAVVHVAGLVSTARRDRQRLVAVNVDGTRNLLQSIRSANLQRVVFTSSTSAVGALFDDRPGDALCEDTDFNLRQLRVPYVQVKRIAHEAALQARQEGLPLVVLSPTLVLGSGAQRLTSMELIDTFVNGRMPAYLAGGLNTVDVRDVACACVAALQHPAPAPHYILAGLENLPMQQFFQRLASVSGLKAPRWRIRRPTALALAAVVQLFAPWSNFSPASVRMGTLYWYFDSSAARRDLKFRPRPLDETLSLAVEWVRTYRGTGRSTLFGEAS